MRLTILNSALSIATVAVATSGAFASTFDLATATDLFVPTFRDAGNSTYVGWDTFGEPGATVITDSTPDLGSGVGTFATTNGEDHQSGSLNYYSGGGTVAERVTFSADGSNGDGFTTVVIQAKTLFGGWGTELTFGPIDGVDPTQVLQATNASGAGQLFVKYELPGVDDLRSFDITSGPASLTSFDQFVVDTVWSPSGFAPDNAIATPEPSALWLTAAATVGACGRRRQRRGALHRGGAA